jgi:hypothetical protein
LLVEFYDWIVTIMQEPCPSPYQASLLLERNPSLVPLHNLAKMEEKLAADNCDSHQK